MKRLLQLGTTLISRLTYPILILIGRGSTRSRVVIFSSNGNLAVVRPWISNGKWHLPGGGKRKNEDSGQGAAREVAEETRLDINPKKLKFVSREKYKKDGRNWVFAIFSISLDSEPELFPLWYEISAVQWIDPKELNETNASADLLICLKNCYNKDYV